MLFTLNNQDIYIHYVYIIHDDTTFSDSNSVLLETETNSEFEIPVEEVYKIYLSFVTDKVHVIDEDDLVRLFETEDLSSVSLKVKLMSEQEQVLHKPLPLLLSGGAGSGKSTISIYRLINEAEQLLQYEEHPKLLYITENERLVNDVKKQFLHLCR
jgi:hypothetical protein